MLLPAFILGLVGSLHCAFMCGPLAMLIRPGKLLTGRVLYNVGRTLTYMMLGGIVGLMGSLLHFGLPQKLLSIGAGSIILILVLFPSVQALTVSKFGRMGQWVKNGIGFRFKNQTSTSSLIAGILNGFIPCGMVYGALVIALVQPTVIMSIGAMAVFGLATIPALLVVAYSNTLLRNRLPVSVSKLQTVTLVIVALILIGRGIYIDTGTDFFAGLPGGTVICAP